MPEKYEDLEIYYNELEAEIVRGWLVENGIDAIIAKDDCGSMIPSLHLTEGVRIRVPVSRFEEGKRLLETYAALDDPQQEQAGENWQCPNCGEESEAQFTHCWNCGTERPEIKPVNEFPDI